MELKLPSGIVSRGDVSRIIRELNKLNDYLVGANFKGEDPASSSQHASPLLSELASLNNINLADEGQRKTLYAELEKLSASAPGLHISFTAAPSAKSLERVLLWLRENIHPQILLQVGLQPTIAAGCILRTPNRIFDLSLKETLKKQQPLLVEFIKGVRHE